MTLENLPKIVEKKSKRVGRGYGSGKGGHTSGRGTKGQKARGDIPIIFEGTKIKKSFVKRLPFNRGRGKLKPWGNKPVIINLKDLSEWPKGQTVSMENLSKLGLINPGEEVKILGDGDIHLPLEVVKIKMSKSAREKVLAAGGKVS